MCAISHICQKMRHHPLCPLWQALGLGQIFAVPQKCWGLQGPICPNSHPHAGIGMDSQMPLENLKKTPFRDGSEHPQGTAALRWAQEHPEPALLPSRSPLSAGLRQLLLDPQPPAAPHGVQPAPERTEFPAGPQPHRAVPACPACFPRGVSDPVCTAVPAPGPCVGGWKMMLRGGEHQRPCSHQDASSQEPPSCHLPGEDTGGLLPPRLVPEIDFTLFPGQKFGGSLPAA